MPLTKTLAAGRSALAVLLAAAMFAGVVQANRQYVYCSVTKQVVSADCCPAPQSSSTASDQIAAPTCCEVHNLPALEPTAPSTRPSDSVQAPVAHDSAVALRDLGPQTISLARGRHYAMREGPPLPASRARARLMVFLL